MRNCEREILLEKRQIRSNLMLVKIFTGSDGVLTGTVRSNMKTVVKGLQPLTLVRMEYTTTPRSELISIHGLGISHQYNHIPYDFNKQCIALYLQEILVKVLPERSPNLALFNFLSDALLLLDDCIRPANLPLWATMEIVRHLGFFPDQESLNDFINIIQRRDPSLAIDNEVGARLIDMLSMEWSEFESIALTSQLRNQCIRLLLQFLIHHMGVHCQFKSVEILHEVMNA